GILGAVDLSALSQMAAMPALRTIVFDSDAARVAKMRRALVSADQYGDRVAVHVGDASVPLPPYFANSVICESIPLAPSTVRHLYESLRPYGGRLFLRKDLARREDLDHWVAEWGLAGAMLSESETHLVLSRE